VTYSPLSGALLEREDPRERGVLRYLEGFMEPLHFGNFGGTTLKWLYFVLGLTPAALSLSGTVVWLERRKVAARSGRRHSGSTGAQRIDLA
jgi:uncharacterized iron-regulated membrane protein